MPEQQFDPNVLTSALQVWKKIYDEKVVVVKFIKKNGLERTMKCTLDFNKIPVPDRPKEVNIEKILKLLQKNQILHVYDLDIKGWRSIPFNTVEYLQSKEKIYFIKKEMKKQ
jgi:hypothetical protein